MAPLLKPGDVVTVRIKETRIVSSYSGFDTNESFQVLAVDKEGYYIYIPDYMNISGTFKLDERAAEKLGVKKQFIDSQVTYIENSQIAAIKSILDGMNCTKCEEFFDMAEPNQTDGTMICFVCRTYRWW